MGLNHGSGNPQNRLVGKKDRALGQSPDLAFKFEFFEIAPKIRVDRGKFWQCSQKFNFFGQKPEVFEVAQGLFKARSHQKVAAFGQTAHIELKGRNLVHLLRKITGSHGDLVEIRNQGGMLNRDQG